MTDEELNAIVKEYDEARLARQAMEMHNMNALDSKPPEERIRTLAAWAKIEARWRKARGAYEAAIDHCAKNF